MTKSSGLPVMAMDNFSVDVTARGPEVLKHTLELVLANHSIAVAFTEPVLDNQKTLVLHWYIPEGQKAKYSAFPYNFKIEQLLPFIMGWLENQDYGEEPDLDGHCTRGWRLFNTQGITHGFGGGSFAIQPVWAEHHK